MNFDSHTEDLHDPWRYIYYLFYLKTKGENELSGLEYYVWNQFQKQSTKWIPIGNTNSMSKFIS